MAGNHQIRANTHDMI
uniref:Uncharacterized protein n=1 Tax=Zea mays TaxID=4577 RepID=C4IZE1_MAIZE|nr:unknown [Zea mays]